jgi:CO/xanthine dehydrogenase Mo-binding subunit
MGHGYRDDPRPNVVRHIVIRHGDPDTTADVSVEGVYEMGIQDQAFLGPESGLAIPDGEGGVDIHVATQWLHVDRDQVAPCLGLEPDQVRIHLSGVGGAFGGREDLSMQIHGAMLALHTNRPVKLVYGREESFVGHVHRHPARIWAEHRATREGRLVCVRMRILLDGGAYASSSTAVTSNAASFACGPYDVPNALIESTSVYTNNPPCGAMRGFGAVQTCFASEAQMDRLAAALEIDPVELRLLNALAPGDTLPTGQVVRGSLPVAEVIRRAAALELAAPEELPRDPIRLPGGAGNTTRGQGITRGTGFAVGFKNICYSEGFDDFCAARVVLSGDSAEIHCAAAEVGQGVNDVVLQVARTELGLDDVTLAPAGTARVDSAGSSSASRLTYMASGAVQLACRAALEERAPDRRGRGRRRARLPPPADVAAGPRDGTDDGRAIACRARGRRDARRRRGRRRARPHARGLDRDCTGRREGDQPAGGRGPDRGRHRTGPRPRPDGGDPDPGRPDHQRELHRLPDPDRARHAAGRR